MWLWEPCLCTYLPIFSLYCMPGHLTYSINTRENNKVCKKKKNTRMWRVLRCGGRLVRSSCHIENYAEALYLKQEPRYLMTAMPRGCLSLLYVRLPKEYALASRYTSEAELKRQNCQTQETESKTSFPQGSDKCLLKNVSQGREMLQSVKCLLHK